MLGLELEECIEAVFVVSVVGEFGGEGAAELNGFGEKDVGLELAGGVVFVDRSRNLAIIEKMLRFLMKMLNKSPLAFGEGKPGNNLPLQGDQLLKKAFGFCCVAGNSFF